MYRETSEERGNCERHAGRGRENRVRESEEREHPVGERERERSETTQWGRERGARPRLKTEREGSVRTGRVIDNA